jgi:hypothetical protein
MQRPIYTLHRELEQLIKSGVEQGHLRHGQDIDLIIEGLKRAGATVQLLDASTDTKFSYNMPLLTIVAGDVAGNVARNLDGAADDIERITSGASTLGMSFGVDSTVAQILRGVEHNRVRTGTPSNIQLLLRASDDASVLLYYNTE